MTALVNLVVRGVALLFASLLLFSCGSDSGEETLSADYFTRLTWKESLTLSGSARDVQEVRVATQQEEGVAPVVNGRWSYQVTKLALGDNLISISAVDSEGDRHVLERTVQRYSVPHVNRSVGVIAHRGTSLTAPENTLAAVHLAWMQGADVVEIDTRLSSDLRVMVIHDESTWKTSFADYPVALTPSSLLRELDVGGFVGPEFCGERIPFLEEVIDAVPPGKKLLIEMKTPDMAPYIRDVVAASGKAPQIMVHTFYLESALQLKRLFPELGILLLADNPTPQLIALCARQGLIGLSIRYEAVNQQALDAAREAGLLVYAWVIRDPLLAQAMAALKVDGILTDRPGEMSSL